VVRSNDGLLKKVWSVAPSLQLVIAFLTKKDCPLIRETFLSSIQRDMLCDGVSTCDMVVMARCANFLVGKSRYDNTPMNSSNQLCFRQPINRANFLAAAKTETTVEER
jgi:hypothetical protein